MKPFTLVEGWKPGALGFIIGEHGRLYARDWGFGAYFEAKVAAELGNFAGRYDPSCDRLFLALDSDGAFLGSLALDLSDPSAESDSAHLRWFILADRARGLGIGGRLMEAAMAHCDSQGVSCWLTTFAGLDAARHLYERHGFSLTREIDAESWGVRVLEQLFERPARG